MSLSLIAGLSLPAAARSLDANVDVCSLRPDLCDDQPQPTRSRKPGRARGLDAESLALSSVNRSTGARRTGRPTTARTATARTGAVSRRQPASNIRSITCRPSSVEMTSANQDLPECGASGRGPSSTSARNTTVSFNAYMNQNAHNPALSRKSIADYQTAFADTAKPATLDVTGLVDGSGVRENAPTPAATPATSRNNQ